MVGKDLARWFIWKVNNRKFFEDMSEPTLEILTHALHEAESWHLANSKEQNTKETDEIIISERMLY